MLTNGKPAERVAIYDILVKHTTLRSGYGLNNASHNDTRPVELVKKMAEFYAPETIVMPAVDMDDARNPYAFHDSAVSKHGVAEDAFELLPSKRSLGENAPIPFSNLFEKYPGCRCTNNSSFKDHIKDCRGKSTTEEVMKHGFITSIDPTVMDLPGSTENQHYPAVSATMEHINDAVYGQLLRALVPIVQNPPDQALSGYISVVRILPSMAVLKAPLTMPPIINVKQELRVFVMQQYGLGGRITNDMLTTARGRRLWWEIILSIGEGFGASAVWSVEKCLFDAYDTSLQKSGAGVRLTLDKKIQYQTIDQVNDHKALFWAAAQDPHPNAWARIYQYLENIIRTQNPDSGERVMVTSRDVARILTKETETAVRQDVSGNFGPLMLRDPLGTESMNISGVQTWILPEIKTPNAIVNAANEFAEIGEYVPMIPGTDRVLAGDNNVEIMTSKHGWQYISMEDVIRALPIWGTGGALITPERANMGAGLAGLSGDDQWGYFPFCTQAAGNPAWINAPSFQAMLESQNRMITDPNSPWKKAGFTVFEFAANQVNLNAENAAATVTRKAGSPNLIWPSDPAAVVTMQQCIDAANGGLQLPFGVILLRLHKMYTTASVIDMIPGKVAQHFTRELNANLVVNQDGTRSIALEGYQGTVLISPKNIVHGRNIAILHEFLDAQNNSGEDATFVSNPDNYRPQTYNYGGAIIPIVVPLWFTKIPTNLNVLGVLQPSDMEYADSANGLRDNGYPSFYAMDKIYSFKTKLRVSPPRHTKGVAGQEGPSNRPNIIARPETYRLINRNKTQVRRITGNGYWPPEFFYADAFRHRYGRAWKESGVQEDLQAWHVQH
jgi:hypothetical protein